MSTPIKPEQLTEEGLEGFNKLQLIRMILNKQADEEAESISWQYTKRLQQIEYDENFIDCYHCDKSIEKESEEHDNIHLDQNHEIVCEDCRHHCDCEYCIVNEPSGPITRTCFKCDTSYLGYDEDCCCGKCCSYCKPKEEKKPTMMSDEYAKEYTEKHPELLKEGEKRNGCFKCKDTTDRDCDFCNPQIPSLNEYMAEKSWKVKGKD